MIDPYIGEICTYPYGFAPKGWAECNGALLQIARNQALFSLIGTTFGGDGQTTFALPDLRGRVAIGVGAGPGLPTYTLGQSGGAEAVALNSAQTAHNHPVAASTAPGPAGTPTNNYIAANSASFTNFRNAAMGKDSLTLTGSNQPHENRQPFLVLTYYIALVGKFPSFG